METMIDTKQISSFKLGDELYGIDVNNVLEVGHTPSLTVAPLAIRCTCWTRLWTWPRPAQLLDMAAQRLRA